MSQANLEIRRISAHPGPVPGAGVKRDLEVAKLIDTTTCIGCKACEVACLEWNDLSFSDTTFQNSYQTMPETAWNFWNLIKFNEYEPESGSLMLLMRKDQCMHCEEPGCLIACPADGAIVQYVNGIVDFNQDQCIGCGYCITGCPFNIPKFSPTSRKVFKCTLCSDRVSEGLEPACIKACPTGCLHFGTKEEMLELGEARAHQLREHSNFPHAGVYNPEGRQRHPRPLRPARRHQSGSLRRPAQEPAGAVDGLAVEEAAQVARQPRHGRRPARRLHSLPALRTENRRGRQRGSTERRAAMSQVGQS